MGHPSTTATATSTWYLATNLDERLTIAGRAATLSTTDWGRRRLARWRRSDFHRSELFERWSGEFGLTDSDWERLLSLSADELNTLSPGPPSWMNRLLITLDADDGCPTDPLAMGLLAPLAPLIDAAAHRLTDEVRRVARERGAETDRKSVV